MEILLLDLNKDFKYFINVEHELFPVDGLLFHEENTRVLADSLCLVDVVI